MKERKLADGRGGKEVGEEPNDTTAKKAWSSINHSILFDAGITGLLGLALHTILDSRVCLYIKMNHIPPS